MKNFIGIDLGTTNSSISSFDGDKVKIWKSPEQNDITPSVIFMNKRTKYYGQRAYDNEPFNSDNTAKLFKRFMGTSTKIEFPALEMSKTPEECSSEILFVKSFSFILKSIYLYFILYMYKIFTYICVCN